jgi:site-specific DNA-methyltransferase (adenine-specific)
VKTNLIVAADARDLIRMIPDQVADLVILDPPYLIDVVTRAGESPPDWDRAGAGDVIDAAFAAQVARIMKPGASCYVWSTGRPGPGGATPSLFAWFDPFAAALTFQDVIVWRKQKGAGTRRGWVRVTEFATWFTKGDAYAWNQRAQYSRDPRPDPWTQAGTLGAPFYRLTNVWSDLGSNVSRPKSLTWFPTPKPVDGITRIVAAHTSPGDLVVDPFLGSGTTAVAAGALGRRFLVGERDRDTAERAARRIAEDLGGPMFRPPVVSLADWGGA